MIGIEEASMAAGQGFSMFSLFTQASWVVKSIIILLIVCSFWSWTVTFAKLSHLAKLKRNATRFENAFWNSSSIDVFFESINTKSTDPFVSVFVTGMREWNRNKEKVKTEIGTISLSDRIVRVMEVAIGRELDFLEQHIGFLATVGSTAPFIGLFGTVWGIMNSFEAIGISQNTNLAAVAPGIAEALFTTALGLIVTIPAVVAYNKIANEINRYRSRLEAFVDEFSAIISRQMNDTEE